MLVVPRVGLPSDCWVCPWCEEVDGTCSLLWRWDVSVTDYTYGHGRHPSCPLYEVPEGAKWINKKKNTSDNFDGQATMKFDGGNNITGWRV